MGRHPELLDAAKGGKPRVTIDKGALDQLYSGFIATLGKLYPLFRSSTRARTIARCAASTIA